MATTRANSTAATTSSALTPEVRRKLKSTVLELRHVLEGDFRRQLGAVAITEDGVKPLAADRALSAEQQRVRDTAVAMLKREVAGGASQGDAFATLLRESVFTFLNRAIGLRCLEARGLLLVDGQTETAITQQDELGGISSLYWRVRNTSGGPAQPREIWRETYRRACVAVSRDIRVLFDPQAEYAALFPLQPAMQRVVEALNDPAIPPAAYREDAVLGWVYQYFQSEEKDRIFAEVRSKKKKIGGADIIPVTQLYTEQYMVDFLLQNSLGRTWMEMYPDSPAKAAWPYYVEPATPHSRPRKPLRDWTILDPCVGSGHFLVVAFDLLVPLYAEERRMGESGAIPLEETVATVDVPLTILERNLYGIDIDRRATQIAALALYLKAREAGLSRSPRVNVVAADASFLQGEAWERFLAGFEREPSVRRVLAAMAGYLKDIRELGSLLRPEEELKRLIAEEHKRWEAAGRPQQYGMFPEHEAPRQERLAFEQVSDETFWEQLAYRAEAAIQGFYDSARASGDLDEQIVAGEAQRGFIFLELCQRRYDVVCTNPPYMGSGNMGAELKAFVGKHYAEGKRDLYGAFILRCRELALPYTFVSMVTLQSCLFLDSYTALRRNVLETCTLCNVIQLGRHAFDEVDPPGNPVLTIFESSSAAPNQRIHCVRVMKSAASDAQASTLRTVANGQALGITFTPLQTAFDDLPNAILAFWVPESLLALLRGHEQLASDVPVKQGLITSDDPRFVRLFWELLPGSDYGWFLYSKGGGFRRWIGFEQYVVDWRNNGIDIRRSKNPRVQNEEMYGKPGLTYTKVARRTLGVRYLRRHSIIGAKGPGIGSTDMGVAAYLNSATITALLRLMSPTIEFTEGNIQKLPAPPQRALPLLRSLGESSLLLARGITSLDPTEYSFITTPKPLDSTVSGERFSGYDVRNTLLCCLENAINAVVNSAFDLPEDAVTSVFQETGKPVAAHPMLVGYSELPNVDGVPIEILQDSLSGAAHIDPPLRALVELKNKARRLYMSGPSTKVEDGEDDLQIDVSSDEGDAEQGMQITIPVQSFLEELSQKLEVHPISVYWLLEEMRRDEGLVCPPEMKRQMEDYASVTLLRELGFRWPEQDTYEAEHGPILDPALVVEDGILPLVDCGTGPTAAQQLRLRLERDFGEEGADESEAEFRKWVGRPLDEWLRRDCFKRHIQQFKQRPIAWHFVSPGKTFEAFVLYHKLCDEATGRETLQRLRAQYAGGLIARLRAEQDRARMSRDDREVTRLQIAIEDVEEFRERLERIERGDELKARIRCRWKGDEAREGRPGPYAPDINDGVKVNVRPFQELGLLAAPVIKKWE